MLSTDFWDIIGSNGAIITVGDAEAAQNSEITILFTPFGKKLSI